MKLPTLSVLKASLISYSKTRNGRIIIALISIGLCVAFLSRIFLDMETASENIFSRGIRAFSWLKKVPGVYTSHPFPKQDAQALFPDGKASLDPLCVCQGSIYDCRFLASVSSMVSSERGKQTIISMIKENPDHSFTISFPGDPAAPVTIPALSEDELFLYAHTRTFKGDARGTWLPVLEKAYGTYRNAHQDAEKLFFRTIKHGLLEGRVTPYSELPGYGASYGSGDDNALALLTGGTVVDVPTASKEIGEFGLGKGSVTWRQVRSWGGRDQVVKEFLHDEDAALREAISHGYPIIAATELSNSPATYGIRPHHAYSVVGYDSKNQLVHIRDVMGPGIEFWDPATKQPFDKIPDGNFSIPLVDFDKLYSHLHYAKY